MENQMHAEDEYLRELIERANTILFYKDKWEKTTQELQTKNQELEKERLESLQKSQELEKERQKREQQEKIILDLALRLKKSGMSATEIQAMTGLSLDEIQNL